MKKMAMFLILITAVTAVKAQVQSLSSITNVYTGVPGQNLGIGDSAQLCFDKVNTNTTILSNNVAGLEGGSIPVGLLVAGNSGVETNLTSPFPTFGTYNLHLFGAKEDGKSWWDGVTAAGSTTFTSAHAQFTSADVGKVIAIYQAGAATGGQDPKGSNTYWSFTTTIAGFVNTNTVTLSAPAPSATTNVYVYGSDDTAAIQAGLNYIVTNGGGWLVGDGISVINGAIRQPGAWLDTTNNNSQLIVPPAPFGTAGNGYGANLEFVGLKGCFSPGYLSLGANWHKSPGLPGTFVLWSTCTNLNGGAVIDCKNTNNPAWSTFINGIMLGAKDMVIETMLDANGIAINAMGADNEYIDNVNFDSGYPLYCTPGLTTTHTNSLALVSPPILNGGVVTINRAIFCGYWSDMTLPEHSVITAPLFADSWIGINEGVVMDGTDGANNLSGGHSGVLQGLDFESVHDAFSVGNGFTAQNVTATWENTNPNFWTAVLTSNLLSFNTFNSTYVAEEWSPALGNYTAGQMNISIQWVSQGVALPYLSPALPNINVTWNVEDGSSAPYTTGGLYSSLGTTNLTVASGAIVGSQLGVGPVINPASPSGSANIYFPQSGPEYNFTWNSGLPFGNRLEQNAMYLQSWFGAYNLGLGAGGPLGFIEAWNPDCSVVFSTNVTLLSGILNVGGSLISSNGVASSATNWVSWSSGGITNTLPTQNLRLFLWSIGTSAGSFFTNVYNHLGFSLNTIDGVTNIQTTLQPGDAIVCPALSFTSITNRAF